MQARVAELMTSPVMTVTKHQTAEHVRRVLHEHQVSALPVVGPDQEPIGIITAADLLGAHAEGTPVSALMSSPVLTVAPSDGPHVAARILRNHHLHHVVVAEHHRVVGMVSAYDLLALVEEHRYTAKPAPTAAKHLTGRR